MQFLKFQGGRTKKITFYWTCLLSSDPPPLSATLVTKKVEFLGLLVYIALKWKKVQINNFVTFDNSINT